MMLLAVDPGSLDLLHDIITPPPVSWWPLQPAWYLLLLAIAAPLALIWRQALITRRQNRYRREGLAELDRLANRSSQADAVPQLAELVKRVALAAYPRERVASLTGHEWLQFLDTTSRTTRFTQGPGTTLCVGYAPGPHPASSQLIDAVRYWIRFHHREITC